MKTIATKKEIIHIQVLCEYVKMKIEELQVLLNKVVNQGLSNNFQKYGKNLINWLDEIEYELLEID